MREWICRRADVDFRPYSLIVKMRLRYAGALSCSLADISLFLLGDGIYRAQSYFCATHISCHCLAADYRGRQMRAALASRRGGLISDDGLFLLPIPA